jgi:protein-glucosylgalactosylhydroxylysine glucosidase
MKKALYILLTFISGHAFSQKEKPIDREAVVRRHTIQITTIDSLASLTIGNGQFAFTADVTGLQSFPASYAKGVPLGTQSDWGWHSFPNTEQYRLEESMKIYELEGRQISYAVQQKEPERNKKAADYFRQNPHRLQLGNIGLEIIKQDGSKAGIADIQNIRQQLNMWTGELSSSFTVENEPVQVITVAHQQQDAIGVKISSPLISKRRLQLRLFFPYPNGEFKDVGNNDASPEKHVSTIAQSDMQGAVFNHSLDTTTYYVRAGWQQPAAIQQGTAHTFLIKPATTANHFEAVFLFTPVNSRKPLPTFAQSSTNSMNEWTAFWKSGGAVDLSGSTDPRALELERRIVLSQYLTKLQCAAAFPPQETGLTYNSWFGKPHLEMHWWHAVHFALWGRPALMEKSLDWYFTVADGAKAIAQRQGFEGIRWQKMTDHAGREAPSSVGSFLIWQQPHLIYMAELLYRERPSKKVLDKYKDLVFATADFMASFPSYDTVQKRYNLGKGLIPAQECFDAVSTFNPTYELAYWHWGLTVAQQWRERLGMPRQKKWDTILNQLAALPQANGVYLATESTPDCYTTERYKTDHPAVLAAFSTLPASNHLDTAVMQRTFDLVWNVWKWEDTWGWDFPLTAMTATRLHKPAKAIDALFMPVKTNTWLINGHNYQDGRLTIYLPGNGGLLSAIAMMCAGTDGSTMNNPGFPATGWKVRWEGLKKMP